MNDVEYAIAYSEVLEILKYIPVEDYNKIPETKIQVFEDNADSTYICNYNPDASLASQNISKRAQAIIAILFRDYWATDEQKDKIINQQKHDRYELENDKRMKYNPDNIFNSKPNVEANIKLENAELAEYKEDWLSKLFRKIKSIFYKNSK